MKLVVAFLASVALTVPAFSAAAAHVDTVDSSVPTQLPRTAIPHHYAITVTPHAARLTFDGTVAIDLEVIEPTNQLVLNAAEMSISSARLQPTKGSAALNGKVTLDPKSETATLTFPRTLPTGNYRLTLAYFGKIHTQANGL
jgi:aminopeptidase N